MCKEFTDVEKMAQAGLCVSHAVAKHSNSRLRAAHME